MEYGFPMHASDTSRTFRYLRKLERPSRECHFKRRQEVVCGPPRHAVGDRQDPIGRRLLALVVTVVLALIAASAQQPPVPVPAGPNGALQAQLDAAVSVYPGKVALFAQDLSTGRTVAIHADTPVPTASVIKLAILYEALEQIRSGRVHFDDKLTVTKADQVPGSGILLFFDTPQTITLHDALTFMVIMSDNTATNLVIDHLGLAAIDQRIQSLGLVNTWLYKKIMQPSTAPMPADQPQFGLGKTTAREMATVLQRFVTCNLGPAPTGGAPAGAPSVATLCANALDMLSKQFYRDGLPRYLDPSGIHIANKTGALDHVRNDVGVIYAKNGPILLSEFTYDNSDIRWTPENSGELLIAHLSQQIVNAWQ